MSVKERQFITQSTLNQAKKNPLLEPLRFVKGVGPKRLVELERLGIESVQDLLFHFPRRYEDRMLPKTPESAGSPNAAGSHAKSAVSTEAGAAEKGLFEGRVGRVRLIRTGHGPTILRLEMQSQAGPVAALWFRSDYLLETFKGVGRIALFGRFERRSGEMQLIHPDYEILGDGSETRRVHTGRIVPFYSATGELTPRVLRTIEYQLLTDALPHIEDPIPAATRAELEIENRRFALKSIHFPSTEEDLARAYRRLVFDEFFFIQLLLKIRRHRRASAPSAKISTGADTVAAFRKLLPFEMTAAQEGAIRAVAADLAAPARMKRLLQGDVGSGKTTVAAFALFAAARAGRQGAILAPTEILAQQHFMTLSRLFLSAGVRTGLLSRGVSAAERAQTLVDLGQGKIDVVVGTHAILQEPIQFKQLEVLVVDEQHKFGVFQRQLLEKKSAAPHVLLMSATPIPQTLAMALFGDMDVTEMKGRPGGRGKISTLWTSSGRRAEVAAWIRREAEQGRQAYVVYPAVDGGVKGAGGTEGRAAAADRPGAAGHAGAADRPGLQSVQAGVERLRKELQGLNVNWIHGKMSSDEKKRVMADFTKNRIHVLAATTVIEVGVDVPNATLMVIENAERFGLSQLHQLRGRIGRGKHDSYCVLVSDAEDPATRERLEAFCETESGFEIAEKDLKLRGPGDIWGARQHGIPQLKIGNFSRDGAIMQAARAEAERWIADDPTLKKPEYVLAREELKVRFPEFEL